MTRQTARKKVIDYLLEDGTVEEEDDDRVVDAHLLSLLLELQLVNRRIDSAVRHITFHFNSRKSKEERV